MDYLLIPIDQLMNAIEADEYVGFCLACGEEAYGVEPDARAYQCSVCNEHMVYGAEEILMMQEA